MAHGELIVHLDRIAENYRTIQNHVGDGVAAAAMVKADAYGLGATEVVPTLRAAGCRMFFVARLDEALAIREKASDCSILVLDGPGDDDVDQFVPNGVFPVINSLPQLELWRRQAAGADHPLPAVLHVDTGMSRLGLSSGEFAALTDSPDSHLAGLQVQLVMSHLASADERDSDQSGQQLARFRSVRSSLATGSASLANSAGIFLGEEYHFDLVRPGYALYGGNPQPERLDRNPMAGVVELRVPVLQVFEAEVGATVGYGASHTLERRSRLATLAIGYGDGFLRAGSGRGAVSIGGHLAPIVGRISMDLTTVDVTDVPAELVQAGTLAEVIGEHRSVDQVASDAGTIGYEVLTDLGRRYHRTYSGRPLSVQDVFEHVGGKQYFVSLVDRFYQGVASDELLSAMYPDDLTEARRNTADFLVQYWGGPDDYNQRRGHPRLRMRHAPFHIDHAAKEAWMKHMAEAVEETEGASEQVKAMLMQYFSTAADHMVNQPG